MVCELGAFHEPSKLVQVFARLLAMDCALDVDWSDSIKHGGNGSQALFVFESPFSIQVGSLDEALPVLG